MELIDALKNIGFTKQEAIIYIALCKNGELTGYEAAKLSGISRSNAYATLSNLVDKGNAHVLEGTAIKYIAVPKDELILNTKRSFNTNINLIENKLDFRQTVTEAYITITDDNNVMNRIKNMIIATTKRLYFSADISILSKFTDELKEACSRDLKVVILSSKDLSIGNHKYYETYNNESLKLIVDTREVITGTLAQSLYSKNILLVQLIRESIINEIELIGIKNNL